MAVNSPGTIAVPYGPNTLATIEQSRRDVYDIDTCDPFGITYGLYCAQIK